MANHAKEAMEQMKSLNFSAEKIADLSGISLEEVKKEVNVPEKVKDADKSGDSKSNEKDKTPDVKSDEKEDKSADKENSDKESNVQKRIDKLTAEKANLRLERDKEVEERIRSSEKIAKLELELNEVRNKVNNPVKNDTDEIFEKQEEKIRKYLTEDANLPREKRREMTKAEQEEFALEDLVGYQEWLTDRNLRRRDDLKEIKETFSKSKNDSLTVEKRKIVEKLQNECAVDIFRNDELLKGISQYKKEFEGKYSTNEELISLIDQKNKKAAMFLRVAFEDANKWVDDPLAPLHILQETEKRLSGKVKKETIKETAEELEARLREEIRAEYEEENSRRSNIDSGSIPSGKGDKSKALTVEQKQAYNKALETGLTEEQAKRVAAKIET